MRKLSLVVVLFAAAACSKSNDNGSGDGGAGAGGDGGGCASTVSAAPGLVVTDRGPVQGATSNGTWAYFAIPYAASPVGDLRWQAPEPPACWSQPIAATTFGSACLQLDTDGATVIGAEDCLTMNVWAPSSATPSSALPVLFFIHGGGNVQGSAGEQRNGVFLYDGSLLAAQTNSVVVTFNYRLGPMGWLAHASFADAQNSTGDYGTRDQLAALGFVQRNVAAFGGDPTRLLLFGESAGAVNVCALLASPLAKGLFAAALMESGGCTAQTSATAQSFANGFAQKVGCTSGDVAGCLRALDANTIELAFPETADVAGSSQGDFQPNVDGVVLGDVPMSVLLAGAHNHVPFIVGSNANETGQAIVAAYPTGMTMAQYDAAVLAYAAGNQTLATSAEAQYPPADYGNDPRAAYIALTSDSKFICTARYVARAAAAHQAEPVRRYFYTHELDGTPVGAVVAAEGAWHGQELLPLFRHMSIAGYTPSAGEAALSDAMDGYWSRFAAAGDPDGGGAVAWPLYDATADTVLQLDDTAAALSGVRTTQCDYWDQVFGR
ncbi:MAG TPA: carboxylesterase family protein [Polyangia bacterium]|jgi:para-nitrobenzyl esterase